MAVVYRYTDLADNTVKYVGIVWSGNRTLKQRDKEHRAEDWCKDRAWIVEYLKKDVKSRTDAEMLEAHYISKFNTADWYNTRKANWGESEYVGDENEQWELYSTDEEEVSCNVISSQIDDVLLSFSETEHPYMRITTDSGDEFFACFSDNIWIKVSDNEFYLTSCFDLFRAIRNYFGYESFNDFVGDVIQYTTSEVDGSFEYMTFTDSDGNRCLPFWFHLYDDETEGVCVLDGAESGIILKWMKEHDLWILDKADDE